MNAYARYRLSSLATQGIDPKIISQASLLVDALDVLGVVIHNVVPNDEEGISFIWLKGGLSIDIEINGTETYEMMIVR